MQRCDFCGGFQATVTFRLLKSKRVPAEDDAHDGHVLRVTIMPPKASENLIFSVPHRLLGITLRRGALASISTIDELLDGDSNFITIKPDFLDKPIFLRLKPRGLGIDNDEPLTVNWLTQYL